MRKDDWITKLYYKQISDKPKSNRNTRENVSSKKKTSSRSTKFRSK